MTAKSKYYGGRRAGEIPTWKRESMREKAAGVWRVAGIQRANALFGPSSGASSALNWLPSLSCNKWGYSCWIKNTAPSWAGAPSRRQADDLIILAWEGSPDYDRQWASGGYKVRATRPIALGVRPISPYCSYCSINSPTQLANIFHWIGLVQLRPMIGGEPPTPPSYMYMLNVSNDKHMQINLNFKENW